MTKMANSLVGYLVLLRQLGSFARLGRQPLDFLYYNNNIIIFSTKKSMQQTRREKTTSAGWEIHLSGFWQWTICRVILWAQTQTAVAPCIDCGGEGRTGATARPCRTERKSKQLADNKWHISTCLTALITHYIGRGTLSYLNSFQ